MVWLGLGEWRWTSSSNTQSKVLQKKIQTEYGENKFYNKFPSVWNILPNNVAQFDNIVNV